MTTQIHTSDLQIGMLKDSERWFYLFFTGGVDCGEDPVIEGARFEVPDLVGVVEEAVAHQLPLPRRQPDQVHLLGHTQTVRDPNQITRHFLWQGKKNDYWNRDPRRSGAPQWTRKTHLVLLLETEGPGEEGGGAGVRAHVRDAPRLQRQQGTTEVKRGRSRRF